MSSPSATASPTTPPSRKLSRTKRKLRNGTFILPGTGERVRRQITLRSANFDGPARGNSIDGDHILPLRRHNSHAGTFHSAVDNTKVAVRDFWRSANSPTGRAIFKCSVAYLLGCMATFLPFLSGWLGERNDGKHMVATITVYFHPGRSIGSMIEGDILAWVAFVYAAFISISSMAVSVLCESQLDLIELGYVLVLVVFCGGGLGFVGWIKQKFSTPLVSVACSLTSLAIVTVLTKENAVQTAVFSNNKIVQVLKMTMLGVVFTTAVNLLVFPISARSALTESFIKTTDSYGDMLASITRGFLSGSESDLRSTAFNNALKRYKSSFGALSKNLKEAKLEHYVLGTERQYELEEKLVKCMQRLAQSIGGLRSAATTQFALLKETSNGNGNMTPGTVRFAVPEVQEEPTARNRPDRFGVLTAIDEASEESSGAEDATTPKFQRHDSYASMGGMKAKTPSDIFTRFILQLGPSMKSLAYTLSEILHGLPYGPSIHHQRVLNSSVGSAANHQIAIDVSRTSLTEALKLYSEARADALRELYKTKDLDRERPESLEADFEEVAASCGHFSFNLQDVGTEMQNYLTILEELKEELERSNRRSWNWAYFWKRGRIQKSPPSPEEESLLEQQDDRHDVTKDLPELALRKESTQWKGKSQEGTLQERIFRKVFHVARFLRRDDIRFAFKVGIGAALMASLAFIPATRPWYRHWRLEWSIVSFLLVSNMTVGASNTTGWARFTGTIIGAVGSVFVWLICQGNPLALLFCSWVFCTMCFYFIVAAGKGPFGRFTLLTYNLSVLYAYSLSARQGEDDSDEGGTNPIITEIALHRLVAVFLGIIWGLIITRIIWPISARKKLKTGLSVLWLRMGLIWKRDPLSMLLEGESPNAYMNLREELALQGYVSRLDALRSAATSEFELRGPFRSKEYARIVESTNKMLDAFHAMNVIIQKDPVPSRGEAILLEYTAVERAQLCARISHLFSVLASSLKLEYPISDGLPTTDNARDRLLSKIFQYRKEVAGLEAEGQTVAKDEDFALIYAYVLVTGQLAGELKNVEKEIEVLFGVMDEDLIRLQ
ncbi:hypothetical protein BP5796_02318 [Coleophoma crateriformis]|uniref:Integral membrane bound transporter domain-containing protein n=1 Tax=Coleophoma crateriformis TaxID=565419 RepID=A0A3D8SXW6_9HELO|nr:hypothetical protein BP5796_02318 [Coleophoma crateriformis]